MIRVSGSHSQSFSGTFKVWQDNAPPTSQVIEANTPYEYRAEGTRIAVDLKNGGEPGMLKVEILKDGRVVTTSMMAGGNGSISVMAM